MKISTKGRYGLSSILEVATKHGDVVSLKSISENRIYLKVILSNLAIFKKKWHCKSIRGAAGGYYIDNELNKITVNILRLLEGDLSTVNAIMTKIISNVKIFHIVRQVVWDRLNNSINHIIDNITLADLVEELENKITICTIYRCLVWDIFLEYIINN